MQLTIYHPGTSVVWADALFASVLQRSDNPRAGQVRKAIAAAVRAYGGLGCVQRVAQEFGDHPEAAADRMRWARAVAGQLFAAHRSHLRGRACEDSPDRPWPAFRRGGWPGDEAHPRRQAEDPTRARLDRGPVGRRAGPRCGPGQGAGPCPADRLVPGQPGSVDGHPWPWNRARTPHGVRAGEGSPVRRAPAITVHD